ncbi:MAG TPA: hypothetical protein VMS73_10075 [Anaerolineaceae bacterium]|nr:hypothetical protein [Anaerolineaceae bacterium]
MNIRKIAVLLGFAFAGWALCDLTMVIGMAVTTMNTILIIHAIAAPIYFAVLSWFYFRNFHYTTPLQTAAIFISFVVFMDLFLVALLINKSLDMFTSLIGTWIPFALIFSSTFLTGLLVRRPAIKRKSS